ncbi:hypothetical protein Tc00.1047053511367.10 [Trypanosoma cruzi]|uniref:Uncharacterized protein n=1 Tax=Trypanosoma cruzi (strain CL Brener) TaxID=353153 RepID=Q4DYJ1_TRYCC|nr:hypothetical protein Tc00.1047053511367.10 [Trypanosoma cruzi]EAN97561.1 hypothetical protein Tc00.1047053511367.10 [Trypanosoma cruzi]|eukprot:XP_819412.1 hypothetical protein [Trypanosoma cruzi strain CL Brener]
MRRLGHRRGQTGLQLPHAPPCCIASFHHLGLLCSEQRSQGSVLPLQRLQLDESVRQFALQDIHITRSSKFPSRSKLLKFTTAAIHTLNCLTRVRLCTLNYRLPLCKILCELLDVSLPLRKILCELLIVSLPLRKILCELLIVSLPLCEVLCELLIVSLPLRNFLCELLIVSLPLRKFLCELLIVSLPLCKFLCELLIVSLPLRKFLCELLIVSLPLRKFICQLLDVSLPLRKILCELLIVSLPLRKGARQLFVECCCLVELVDGDAVERFAAHYFRGHWHVSIWRWHLR